MNIPNATERGYIAGMLDGEGSIYRTTKGINAFNIVIYSSDKKPLLKIKKILGIGTIYTYRQSNSYCVMHRFGVYSKSEILELLVILAPILVIKQKKAREAIKLLKRAKPSSGKI